jgi:hypothetical protein
MDEAPSAGRFGRRSGTCPLLLAVATAPNSVRFRTGKSGLEFEPNTGCLPIVIPPPRHGTASAKGRHDEGFWRCSRWLASLWKVTLSASGLRKFLAPFFYDNRRRASLDVPALAGAEHDLESECEISLVLCVGFDT